MKKGDKVKNFTLMDQHYRDLRLSGLAGRKVLLSFHPLAWTSVCTRQMKALEKNRKIFDRLNTVALGISVDAPPSKEAWAKSMGVRATRLLSDFWPHGAVAKKYGVFRARDGFSGRANIVIDEDQRIVFIKKYPIRRLPDLRKIIAVLKNIR
jgi:peroxiredoxin